MSRSLDPPAALPEAPASCSADKRPIPPGAAIGGRTSSLQALTHPPRVCRREPYL